MFLFSHFLSPAEPLMPLDLEPPPSTTIPPPPPADGREDVRAYLSFVSRVPAAFPAYFYVILLSV